MIVGVVLSVPATPLAQRARRRDFRLGEPPRQRRQGPEDAEVIKPGAVLGSVFSAGPPGPPQPRPPGPAWPAGPRPGYRHGHIPPAHARDQPESARSPVAGLEEQNDCWTGGSGSSTTPASTPRNPVVAEAGIDVIRHVGDRQRDLRHSHDLAKAGISSASRMSRNWSAAVLTVAGRPRWRRRTASGSLAPDEARPRCPAQPVAWHGEFPV